MTCVPGNLLYRGPATLRLFTKKHVAGIKDDCSQVINSISCFGQLDKLYGCFIWLLPGNNFCDIFRLTTVVNSIAHKNDEFTLNKGNLPNFQLQVLPYPKKRRDQSLLIPVLRGQTVSFTFSNTIDSCISGMKDIRIIISNLDNTAYTATYATPCLMISHPRIDNLIALKQEVLQSFTGGVYFRSLAEKIVDHITHYFSSI